MKDESVRFEPKCKRCNEGFDFFKKIKATMGQDMV